MVGVVRLISVVLFALGFSLSSAFADRVKISDLARRLELDVVQLPSIHKRRAEGDWFWYGHPEDYDPHHGILIPRQDQSLSSPTLDKNFAATIFDDGTIPDDAANSIADKARQLRVQERYGGPQIKSLGIISDSGISELVIVVENVPGISMPREVHLRDPRANAQFFSLFIRLSSVGLIPLDFKFNNVKFDPETYQMRPIDLMLVTFEELSGLVEAQARIRHLRFVQLAHTVIEIDRAANDDHQEGYVCRSIVQEIARAYPQYKNYEQKLRKQLHLDPTMEFKPRARETNPETFVTAK